jgi:hypothetical protein
MISKYVSLPVFLVSLALGILCSYFWGEDLKVVYVYPTPENVNIVQYKDKSDSCYSYKPKQVRCPSDKALITQPKIQDGAI